MDIEGEIRKLRDERAKDHEFLWTTLVALEQVLIKKGIVSPEELRRAEIRLTATVDQDVERIKEDRRNALGENQSD